MRTAVARVRRCRRAAHLRRRRGTPSPAPPSRTYFASALRILRVMHRAGVTHNDLAKEANWLVLPDGSAGIIDFQLARHKAQRDRAFRRSAYSDLRHLLKHKRTYQRQWLTSRQRRVLAAPT